MEQKEKEYLPLQADNLNKASEPNSTQRFREDVLSGLQSHIKKLDSKYFYDQQGDSLFQDIMQLPEYYVTRCELAIFKNNTRDLINAMTQNKTPFDLIELGAGDATKSIYLLKELLLHKVSFQYVPIDISGNILTILQRHLSKQLPDLNIHCIQGEYFDGLKKTSAISSGRKVVLFLGGNIGNMSLQAANSFCRELRRSLNPGDLAIIGFDLKKHPQTILNAYNDKAGVTAKFNLNLLQRINKELDGHFNLSAFEHYQTYDPLSGACKSYLISLSQQSVQIGSVSISFDANEPVFMEISQKFSLKDTRAMAEEAGFSVTTEIMDKKQWFLDSIWCAI
jgi:L-histidine N-alpha-methyltransferase